MKGFAEWAERRRKILGYERQVDLSEAAYVSLSIVQQMEGGGLLPRSRSHKKLLADALRVEFSELERLAAGKIRDAPIRGMEVGGTKVVDAIRWLVQQDGRQQAEVVGALTPEEVVTLAQVAMDRLQVFARTTVPSDKDLRAIQGMLPPPPPPDLKDKRAAG
jgi:predicted transcriptional regulator